MSRNEVLQFLKNLPGEVPAVVEGQVPPIQFRNNTYHQRQFIGVSWRTRQGRQAGADLVVTVTTPNWQHCDVPELVGLVLPLLSHCRVEIYTEQRFHIHPNLYFILKIWHWKKFCLYFCLQTSHRHICPYPAGTGPGPALELGEGRPGWWWGWPGWCWSGAECRAPGPPLHPWSDRPPPHSEEASSGAAGRRNRRKRDG